MVSFSPLGTSGRVQRETHKWQPNGMHLLRDCADRDGQLEGLIDSRDERETHDMVIDV